ncbi:MAG: hydrolase TatD [Deltaproteobacteria bacterium RBG_13_52_11]|nr:MAG: hydrolase TatD [Deltaproteobacteria bacterium RBG_13_52_11]
MLVDTHAHLDMSEFEADLPRVIQRAEEAGVSTIMTVGTDPASCRRTLEITEAFPNIFAIVGVHPHNAAEVGERDLDSLKALAHHEKVKAWGEIGLDFYRNLSPSAIQNERFRQQITIAKELKLPVIIHSRSAAQETITTLQEERAWEVGGVIHCFSGDAKTATRYLEIGFVISIPGVITFKKAQGLREVVKRLPPEGIILETDAPFLAPEPHRGKRNEPAYVRFTAEAVAETRGQDISEVAAITTKNARRVFNLDKR